MKLSDYIVTFLQKKGIRHFFGYQGTMIAHLVDSIERNPETENHSSYNEQGAAFAACGYAQAKEECACAYATSGPGAINLLSGVADAYYDSLPVIFLTGQLNTYEYSGIKGLRQQGFQETDIVAMAKPITKYAVQIRNPEDIVEELNKAYHIATTGRRGPVLIDLPMNIQRSEVENPVYDMTFEDKHTDAAAAQQAADTILEALEQAKRPVIMLGHGVDSSFSQQKLIRFAQKRQIPIHDLTKYRNPEILNHAADKPNHNGKQHTNHRHVKCKLCCLNIKRCLLADKLKIHGYFILLLLL